MTFSFLGTWYLCILTDILKLHSGVHLSYLETVWSSGSCFLRLISKARLVFILKLIILKYWGKILQHTVMLCEFWCSAASCGNWPRCTLNIPILWIVLSKICMMFPTFMGWSVLYWILGGGTPIARVLSLQRFFFIHILH